MALQLKRGTRAKIDALALRGGLLEGEPLFITDESRVAVASDANNFSSMKKYTDEYQPYFSGTFTTKATNTSNYTANIVQVGNIGFTLQNTNTRLVSNISGRFLVLASQLVSTAGVTAYWELRRNGVNQYHAYSDNDVTYDLNLQGIVELNAGDYLEFYYLGTTTYAWGDQHSKLSVCKIN